jgi:hypothetical protein
MESRLAYFQVADRPNGIDVRIDGFDRKIEAFRESAATDLPICVLL